MITRISVNGMAGFPLFIHLVAALTIESRAFCMLGKHSTRKLRGAALVLCMFT